MNVLVNSKSDYLGMDRLIMAQNSVNNINKINIMFYKFILLNKIGRMDDSLQFDGKIASHLTNGDIICWFP